jgi:DNA polymerase III epsilon subunit-like protein
MNLSTIFIIASILIIIVRYLIKKSLSDDNDEQEIPKIPKIPPLPDFVKRDPQTGEMIMDIIFESSSNVDAVYLFLDTETTGLPKFRDAKPEDLNSMPRIVQISWTLLDSNFKGVNTETCYLKQDAPIPKEAIKIHGIDDKMIEEKGEDQKSVFEKLLSDINKTKYIIAHNVEFDIPIIESEFIRYGLKSPFKDKKKLCTMKEGASFCKIPNYSGRGYKYPKLEELLEHCYFPGWSNIKILEAHNAKTDVAITAKCFIKLKELGYFKGDDEIYEKSKEDNNGKVITFTGDYINQRELSNCNVGDYVTLWTQPDMNRVIIYAPGSAGGMGQLGIVPEKYFKTIQAHILRQKDYGMSGPSTNNYDATILNISRSSCTIEIKLFSPEEHEKIIMDMIDQEKKATKASLEKHYKMIKPVEIKFSMLQPIELNLGNLKLKIFEKEYYIEHPYYYKLQLVDETNKVVAETFSQKDKVFRVVKGYYNGQKMVLTKIETKRDYLNVFISGE